MHCLPIKRRAAVIALAAACAGGPANPVWAGQGTPAPAPRDAAEKVQEGNVKNWIEYYQRDRGQAPKDGGTRSGNSPAKPEPPTPPKPADEGSR